MEIRPAGRDDLPAVVALLAEDRLGRQRENRTDPVADEYVAAFDVIARDPNNTVVVLDDGGDIVGTLQLTLIPHLTFGGGWRAQVEGVRISARRRGQGLGRHLMEWAISEASRRGCHLVQLTTNKKRREAHRFYASLGFEATHEGMKLYLDGDVSGR